MKPPSARDREDAGRPATLADVARRAGVSLTTASFVLNGRPAAIAEATRQRVLDAARALHYAQNAHVAALHSRRSQTLGIHLHDYKQGLFLTDPVMDRVMTGITAAARERRHHLFLYTGLPDYEDEAPASAFLDRRVDGLVLVHAPTESRLMADLAEVPLPCVVLFNRHAPAPLGSVDADNITGARRVVEYLAGLGHRRIAHLTWDMPSSNGLDRVVGYGEGLDAAGQERRPELLVRLWSSETAEFGLQRLLSLPEPPTAVFCFNDLMAAALVRAAEKTGLRVPHDLSVVGFDDIPLASLMSPALTTVRQPLQEMGRLAAAGLIDMIEGRAASECRYDVPAELVVRESTGPPS